MSGATSVLAARRFPGPALEEIEELEIVGGSLADHLAGSPRDDVGAVIVAGEVVSGPLLDLLPGLRVVANYGVGYDGIDVAACARRGVAVSNTPGVVDQATADLAMALILAGRRRLVEADRMVRRGDWRQAGVDLILASEVHGSRLGIVGLGRIGKAVAERARGFGMEVAYTQRSPLPAEEERRLGARYLQLDDLIPWAQTVTLHCPLTDATRHLLGPDRLTALPDGALLVNTARGPIVDEAALIAELSTGRIAAALDVFSHEPRIPRGLADLPNVILTPHMGTGTDATREAMTRLVVDNVLAGLAGRPLPTEVTA